MSAMRLVYVIGPYRASTAWQRDCNIHKARAMGAAVAELGAMPVIPHSNTAHMDGLCSDEFWLEGTLELMRRCDAVITLPLWDRSTGSRGEVAEATARKMPVFHSLSGLASWLDRVGL